eukprot:g2710.t1
MQRLKLLTIVWKLPIPFTPTCFTFLCKSNLTLTRVLIPSRSLASKSKGLSLQPRFSKDQPWKDLNRKKQRRGPNTSKSKTKRGGSSTVKEKKEEDYYQTMFSKKGTSTTSFQDLHIVQPLEDDVWGQNTNEFGSQMQTSKKKSDDLFSLSEPTSKAKQEGLKLEQHLKTNLIQAQCDEIVLPQAFASLSMTTVESVVKALGLYWQMYGTKGKELKLVSKYPLARYRPEFDPRTKLRHRIRLDDDILGVVKLTLNTLRFTKEQLEEQRQNEVPQNPDTPSTTSSTEDRQLEDMSSDDEYTIPSQETEAAMYPAQGLAPVSNEDLSRLHHRLELFRSTDSGRKMQEIRRSLPSWKYKPKLLKLIKSNQVVVVSGETGCGKTTQIPQFLLEDAMESGTISETNIIVTQPRRISAMSVAQRVADERGEASGDLVGYQIRMSSRRSNHTRLLFCTSGVLLRRLIGDRGLDSVSHIIVDEIHERGMNEDFLLIVLRNLLRHRPDLRVVLMSATLDSDSFSAYFSNAPTIHIPGFMHPVQELFLEDVLEKTGYQISASDKHLDRKLQWYQKAKSNLENSTMLNFVPKKSEMIGYKESTFASIRTWASCSNDKLHYGLIESTVEYICNHEAAGGVLVFLTSWEDIQTMMEILQSNPIVGNPEFVKLLPLHSTLASISQEEIFKVPPLGIRKIVLATNIAETSITINDIVYVVNGGKAKEKSYDALNKIACLFPTWISKASCVQRRGRAGRVQSGMVFHLFPRAMYKDHFLDHQLPEIMRTPLAELCLQIKSLGLGSMQEFMSGAMNPPSPQTIQNAILQLRAIGAINQKQELTPLGRHLAHIPVEPSLGKMILMAAASTVKDPFLRPANFRKEAESGKVNLSAGTCSDHIALLRAFEGFREAKSIGLECQWDYCRKHFFQHQSFEQMEKMRLHFAELLANIGFLNVVTDNRRPMYRRRGRDGFDGLEQAIFEHSKNSSTPELLRAVLCSGMFPSIASVLNDGKRPSFLTLEDGTVRPHMSSVNSLAKFFPHRWLIYTDKVQTGGILFRNSTMVTDLAVLLFGGDVEIDDAKSGKFSILNGRHRFEAHPDVMQIIVDLRLELQALMERKIREPKIDIFEEGGSIVGAVMTLLSNEREPNIPRIKSYYQEALDQDQTTAALQ